MESAELVTAGTALWDIATPSGPGRLAGVAMAGFRDQSRNLVDLKVVPHPSVTLVVDLGGGVLVQDASGRQLPGSVAAGLAPGSVRALGRDIECLQIRLSPVVAHELLGAPSELDGSVVALEDLWGRDVARIQAQMRAADSWDDRFAIAEVELARRPGARRSVDPEVAYAWGEIAASRGRVRIERLATCVGWSRKRLWSRFRSQIGLTPKRAAQLVRFDHAAHELASGHDAALVAAQSGYVDQSHLHRDVMSFTGITPTAVAAAPWLAVDQVAWTSPEQESWT